MEVDKQDIRSTVEQIKQRQLKNELILEEKERRIGDLVTENQLLVNKINFLEKKLRIYEKREKPMDAPNFDYDLKVSIEIPSTQRKSLNSE